MAEGGKGYYKEVSRTRLKDKRMLPERS